MKFYSILAIVSSVAAADTKLTVANWNACIQDSDCKTTGYQCCEASKLGYASALICGGSSFTTVPSSGGEYAGFHYQCMTNKSRERWATCQRNTDCVESDTDACCFAYRTGYQSKLVCGPKEQYDATIIPKNLVGAFGGFSFKCERKLT